MSDSNSPKQILTVPPWLLTGVITLADMIDMIVESENLKRELVEEAVRLFFEVVEEKFKEGYSINMSFGTFVPSFGEPNPITGEASLSVKFVPTKKTLSLIEKKRIERLNHFSLN